MPSGRFLRAATLFLAALGLADGARAAQATNDRDYVYVYAPSEQGLLAYLVRPESGSLELVASITGPARVAGLATDPLGRFLYVGDSATGKTNRLVSLRIDRGTGRLAPAGVSDWSSASARPARLIATPDHVYLAASPAFTGADGGLLRFELGPQSGALTRVAFPTTSTEPAFVAVDGERRFAYSAGRMEQAQVLETYGLGADGSMFRLSAEAQEAPIFSGAVGGGFLFVSRGRELLSLALDPLTGRARGASSQAFEDDPYVGGLVAADPEGRVVALLTGRSELQIYSVGAAGKLARTDSLALESRPGPWSLAIDPGARLLFLSHPNQGLRVFHVDAGRLSESQVVPGGGPLAVLHTTAP